MVGHYRYKKIKNIAFACEYTTDIREQKGLHLVKSLNKSKYSSGSFSVSLGNLAPISLNQDFHTTINDIYVTVETLKLYFSIPIIIDYNDKIKISNRIKEIVEKI